MIEVGTKLLLAESGGWQVLRVRAARLPLSALAWLLLGVPATTQAAAAAAATAFIFYFFPEKCRVQTPTPSAQAAAQLVSYGLFNLDFSLLPSPFQAGSPKLIKQRGRKNDPRPKSVPLLLHFPAWICTFWPQEWHAVGIGLFLLLFGNGKHVSRSLFCDLLGVM